MLCSICNKNTAVIFINKQDESGKQSLEGLCYECAKKKGINPIDSMMKQANISEKDLADMTNQIESMIEDMSENMDLSDINIENTDEASGNPQFGAIPLGSIFSNMFGQNSNNESSERVSGDEKKKVKVEDSEQIDKSVGTSD